MNGQISQQELNKLINFIGIDNIKIIEALKHAYKSGFEDAYIIYF